MRIEHLLAETLEHAPERVALDDGERQLSYRQLAAAVSQEADFLRATGGLRFAILADNGCGWVIADLALHHLSQINVPLPQYFTLEQQRHTLDSAGIDTVLTDDAAFGERGLGTFTATFRSPWTGLHVFTRTLTSTQRPQLDPDVTKVTFTSGTTSEPRGVCLKASTLDRTSRSLVEATAALRIGRHLSLMPLSVLLENVAGVYTSLRTGATCLLPACVSTGMSFESLQPDRILATISRLQPESLILVPELLRLLVGAASSGRWSPPGSLKFIAVGGATVSPDLLAEAERLGLPVYEGYGLSECGSVVCLNTPEAKRRGSVGKVLPHASITIDASGELHVGGSVMTGYLGSDSAAAPAHAIATGDIGHRDADGFIYLTGRRRNVLITSLGRNVSPEWVERELLRHPAIAHAVVTGEGQASLSAWICTTRDCDDGIVDKAVELANARLPPYAWVRHWAKLPEVPARQNGLLTGNGRLRRNVIIERFGLPEPLSQPCEASA